MRGRHHRPKRPKRILTPEQKRRRRIVIFSSIGAAVVLAGTGTWYAMTRPLTHSSFPDQPPRVTKIHKDGRTNILLIGTDTRPGETGGNTDVLMLVSLDPHHHRIEMMSIPRDTRVTFPDGTVGKINEALDLGGPNLVVNMVQTLLNEPVDHWALTHFGGLVNIINTIGGITVYVPERMRYNTGDKQYGIINLNPGTQTLMGPDALGFVRFRMDPLGDIGRTKRQQEFLVALYHKLLQPQNIPKLPKLLPELMSTVETDMTLAQLSSLAAHANQYKNYQIIHETLPGSYYNTNTSYWLVNTLEARYVANQFFQHGIVQPNIIQSVNDTLNWTPPASSSSAVNGNSADDGNQAAVNPANGGSSGSDNGTSATEGNSAGSDTTSTGGSTTMIVTGTAANIRSGPGLNYPVIGTAVHGNTVEVVGKSGDWDKVVVNNGETGYIASFLLGTSK
ncbi:MAG: LCP family protein [Alicyclobacillus sp.]|nr:LCP family protein [Alicyclobacillus sp.]